MNVEEQLRHAMDDHTAAVGSPADRWAEIEARVAAIRRAEARRRSRRRVGGLTALGVATAAVAALVVLPALVRTPSRRVVVRPASQPHVVTPSPVPSTAVTPATSTPATGTPATSTPATGTPATSTPSTAPTTAVPTTGSAYLPLYPFANVQQADAWQTSYAKTGSQPWHLDAGETALSFTDFLGYTDVTNVITTRNDATGAHVTVGFPNPNGGSFAAAVIHLRRFGAGPGAPWEVVGTDDTSTFSLTTPRYGAVASSPLKLSGAIMGVDENIRVEVLQASSATPLGTFCCQPAGNSGAPWGATVTFHKATDQVLIVAASTGGGLQAVGRFAVTGVRTRTGTTPGL